MPTYADDIEFVLLEAVRIGRMDPRETLKLPFPENMATLPHPSGTGQMLCGAMAYKRLQSLVDLALSRSQHAGRIEPEAVFTKLKSVIVRRFLCEKRELNTREADRAVSAAIKAAARARTDLTHFVPCHLGHAETPESISIGPVRFQPRNVVIERLEPDLQAYLEEPRALAGTKKPEDRRELREKLLAHAREYYGSFGWVAEVTIHDFDPPTSRQRGRRIVQSALDCLHLLIGTAYSSHMRVGGPSFRTDRRGQFEVDANGNVKLSASVDWLGHNLGDGWWEMVNSEGGDHLIELMGVAIEAGHDIPRPAPLAQRFLDGVAWYGEAVRDEFAASRLIKYVTAIERILTTKNEENLIEVLANRGSALIHNPGEDDLETLRKRFRGVYDLRSHLVHGSQSPLDAGFGPRLREAENLARSVLFRALQFFKREGLEVREVSSPKLDDAYGTLLEWADATTPSA